MVVEALANIPATAHILGGAVIGRDASTGVVDDRCRVFGYENLLVCDGSVVPANPGVNPEPDDHGDRGARDEPRAGRARDRGRLTCLRPGFAANRSAAGCPGLTRAQHFNTI